MSSEAYASGQPLVFAAVTGAKHFSIGIHDSATTSVLNEEDLVVREVSALRW